MPSPGLDFERMSELARSLRHPGPGACHLGCHGRTHERLVPSTESRRRALRLTAEFGRSYPRARCRDPPSRPSPAPAPRIGRSGGPGAARRRLDAGRRRGPRAASRTCPSRASPAAGSRILLGGARRGLGHRPVRAPGQRGERGHRPGRRDAHRQRPARSRTSRRLEDELALIQRQAYIEQAGARVPARARRARSRSPSPTTPRRSPPTRPARPRSGSGRTRSDATPLDVVGSAAVRRVDRRRRTEPAAPPAHARTDLPRARDPAGPMLDASAPAMRRRRADRGAARRRPGRGGLGLG